MNRCCLESAGMRFGRNHWRRGGFPFAFRPRQMPQTWPRFIHFLFLFLFSLKPICPSGSDRGTADTTLIYKRSVQNWTACNTCIVYTVYKPYIKMGQFKTFVTTLSFMRNSNHQVTTLTIFYVWLRPALSYLSDIEHFCSDKIDRLHMLGARRS